MPLFQRLQYILVEQRQDVLVEACEHRLATVLCHHFVKARIVLVTDATSLAEAVDNAIFHLAEQANVLGENGHVVRYRGARQQGGMGGGEVVIFLLRRIPHHTSGDHGAQPFLDIARGQPSLGGYVIDVGRRQLRHGVEQPRAVADGDHQRQRALVKHVQQLVGESINGFRLVHIQAAGIAHGGHPRDIPVVGALILAAGFLGSQCNNERFFSCANRLFFQRRQA